MIKYTVGNSYVLDFVPLPRRLIVRAHLVLYQYLEHDVDDQIIDLFKFYLFISFLFYFSLEIKKSTTILNTNIQTFFNLYIISKRTQKWAS